MAARAKKSKAMSLIMKSVKMPTSHGVVQGYNAQALVDSKASGHSRCRSIRQPGSRKSRSNAGRCETEIWHRLARMRPILKESNSRPIATIILSTVLNVCQDEKIDAYIPDIQFPQT